MESKPSIIFDTSGWNQLHDDPDSKALVAGLKAGFFVCVTATNTLEIAATADSTRRESLFSLCRALADNYLFFYTLIIHKLIIAHNNDHDGFDWRNIRVEDLQDKVERMVFDDDLANSLKRDNPIEKNFKALYAPGRVPIQEAARNDPSGLPKSFEGYLKQLQEDPALFPESVQYHYYHYGKMARRKTDTEAVRVFFDLCPPFRALLIASCFAEYDRWIQDHKPSKRAGARDLFSAVYLPYCSIFVTDDRGQLDALNLVAIHGDLKGVKIFSYREFCDSFSLTTAG